jgi:hypothetical protein
VFGNGRKVLASYPIGDSIRAWPIHRPDRKGHRSSICSVKAVCLNVMSLDDSLPTVQDLRGANSNCHYASLVRKLYGVTSLVVSVQAVTTWGNTGQVNNN